MVDIDIKLEIYIYQKVDVRHSPIMGVASVSVTVMCLVWREVCTQLELGLDHVCKYTHMVLQRLRWRMKWEQDWWSCFR